MAFPPYRHVPGTTPHPVVDPAGHSYESDRTSEQIVYRPPEEWSRNRPYLYGIDLYHQSFFWEAHEAWEELWVMAGRDEPEGRFLQALIQNTAAQLKVHLGVVSGVRSLSRHAWEKLCFVRDSDECDEAGYFMGIHLQQLIQQMERHYGALWASDDASAMRLIGRPPKLLPSSE